MNFITKEDWNQSFKKAAEKYNVTVSSQADEDMNFMYEMYNKNKHEIYEKVLKGNLSIIFPIEIDTNNELNMMNYISYHLNTHARAIFMQFIDVKQAKEKLFVFNKNDQEYILKKISEIEPDKSVTVFAKLSIAPEDFLNIGSIVKNRHSCSRLMQNANPSYPTHYWYPSSAPYYLLFSTAILTVFDSKEKAEEAKDSSALLRNVVSFNFNDDDTIDIGFNRSYFDPNNELFVNSQKMTFLIQDEVKKYLGIKKTLKQYVHENTQAISPLINGVDLVCYSGYYISSTDALVFAKSFDVQNIELSNTAFVNKMKSIASKIINYHKYLLETKET